MAFKPPRNNHVEPPADKPGAPELGGKSKAEPPVNPTPQLAKRGLDFRPQRPAAAETPPATVPTPSQDSPADTPAHDHERLDYLRTVRQSRPGKSHRLRNAILIIVLVLLVCGGVAGAAYWLKTHPQKSSPASNTTNSQANQPSDQSDGSKAQPTSGPFTSETKQFQSNNFGLTIDYPSTWTPTENPNVMTITSPATDLVDASGMKQTGVIVLTVRPKQASLPEFSKGNAVAVLDSQKISYSQPSPGQRGETYLSFLQYASTTTKGGWDGIYITGNAGYQKGQAVPMVDISKVDPLVTVTFLKCADANCAVNTRTPLTLSSNDWEGYFQTAVTNMLKSLSIQ